VMRYTRRFWYGVQCALLVRWGTPYCWRYAPRAKNFNGRLFIAHFHDFSSHSFSERLPESPEISRLLLSLLPLILAMQHRITTLLSCESAGAFPSPLVRRSSQAGSYHVVMQVCLSQAVESESELSESGFVACMPQIYHAWKGFRSNMIVLMDGVA